MSEQVKIQWLNGEISEEEFYTLKEELDADVWADDAEYYDRDAYMEDTLWG